ncbi:hypothetical protein FHR84_000916 [Actinopolyspora biskrensis]|uniref:Uncharacterized protein n=1 Tax=Actinopolyspora biskrensis TaxID=1470178 RepID=A0A852YV42_9ACTN|nr:hypothetical protein [Actinopolyspora biskrensis]NYH77602.1 hypothetical protein [Actinopolyspora biskrensis]
MSARKIVAFASTMIFAAAPFAVASAPSAAASPECAAKVKAGGATLYKITQDNLILGKRLQSYADNEEHTQFGYLPSGKCIPQSEFDKGQGYIEGRYEYYDSSYGEAWSQNVLRFGQYKYFWNLYGYWVDDSHLETQ